MPRHYPPSNPVPSKSVIGLRQETWELLVTRRAEDGNALAANSVAVISAYTVPANKRLYLGGGVISCNVSCIQKVVMTHTPGLLGDFRYDVQGQIVLNPLAAVIVDPGDTITIYLYNNDSVARDFSISLIGMLELVFGE